MTSTIRDPPLDGSIPIIPGFVDFHAQHNSRLPWAIFPSRHNPKETTTVSFQEYAEATHRMAHILRPGRAGKDGEIVAVLINCDTLLYLTLLVAMVRAGLVPFPMSPKNFPEGVASMLERTNCHRIIVQQSLAPLTSPVKSQLEAKGYSIQVEELSGLDLIYPGLFSGNSEASEVKEYPPSGKSHSPDDIVLYLHSSGSTGFPKPIPQTQKTILHWCSTPITTAGRKHRIRWASMAMPTFHTLGINMQLYAPLVSGEAIAIYTPEHPAPPVMPNPQNVIDIAKLTGCSGMPSVPAFIELWAQSADAVAFLASMKILAFAGGPLSESNGTKLAAAGVKLFAIYGGTEFGAPTDTFDTDDSQGPDAKVKTSADWAWMKFPATTNTRWIPQGDGTYELHFLTCETHQPSIENLPDVKGYATSDLWESHPTKPGLWRIVGRTDDVIVLGLGEKIVPIPQEGYIGSLPYVAGAVMFGRGKNQAGILIEPRPQYAFDPKDETALVEFRNKLWPHVEEANKLAPTFARIFKEMIIVTDPTQPMARAAKGTVMRKLVLATYENEIEALYETIEASTDANGIDPPKSWTAKDIEVWLCQHATSINDEKEPSTTADIFEQGFDSLSATFLRNRIIGALRSSPDPACQKAAVDVPQDFIFAHPTLQQLSVAVVDLMASETDSSPNTSRATDIEQMITKYTALLPAQLLAKTKNPESGIVVLLTGSTGSLGSHILASLLAEEKVNRIYTLDRSSSHSVPERQKHAFEERGLPAGLLGGNKLTALDSDLSREDLGIPAETLNKIKSSVTHIIHNAWKVDFNLSLSSFERYIASTCKLVNLSSTCVQPVKFLFTSSITVAFGRDPKQGTVPEEVILDANGAVGNGYASSKYVIERLLEKASQIGQSATSLRIGQICGSSTTGAWPMTDWVPILIKSSVALGCLPESVGVVSWVPMDTVSGTIVDTILSPNDLPNVLNIVHPRPVTWNEVLAAINAELGLNLPSVSFETWYKKLETLSLNASTADLERIPALKLLSFFRGMATWSSSPHDAQDLILEAGGVPLFATTKSQSVSATLRDVAPLSEAQAALWVKYWRLGDKDPLRLAPKM